MKKLILALTLIPTLALGAQPSPTVATQSALTNNNTAASTAYADGAVSVEKSRAQAAEATLAPLAGATFTGPVTVPTLNSGAVVPTVTTDAALKAFPVTGLAAGSTVQDTGYYAAGDMPPVTYLLQTSACSLNGGAGDGGSQIPSNTAGKCWVLQKSTQWDVRNFGAYCNYSTQNGTGTADTTAIQNAVNAAQTMPLSKNGVPVMQLHFPPSCESGPLSITRPVVLVGDGENLSHLAFTPGASGALFTVALAYDNGNYYALGAQPATVIIKHMALDGPGAADSGVADGIDLTTAATNPVYGRIILEDTRISYFAGHNISGQGFGANGYVILDKVTDFAAGKNGLNCNSNYDWQIINSNFYGSANDNILLSGCAGIKFFDSSAWTAGVNNLQVFQSPGSGAGLNQWFGGSLDHAGNYNVFYDDRATNSPFLFSGVTINNAGTGAVGAYSDIYVTNVANNDLLLNGVLFSAPNSVNSSNDSLWNVQFQGATQYVSTANVSLQSTAAQAYSNQYQVVGYSWRGEGNAPDELHTGGIVTFTGNASGYAAALPQGPSLGWNYSNGTGESDLFLGQGPGSAGGLYVYPVNSSGTIGSRVLALDATGNLSVGGNITASGLTSAGYVTNTSSGLLGTVSSIPNTSISGLGTASTQNTGTSGTAVPLLSGANTWSGKQNFSGNVSPFTLNSSSQYTGFTLSNGTNTVASIAGYSSTNDVGVLSLENGGTTNAQLSAGVGYATNFINGGLTLGNGSSSSTPATGLLYGTNGSGTNITGADLNVQGGQGTGSATSGGVEIKAAAAGTSGSTANALSNYFRVDSAGASVQNGALIFKTTPYTVATLPTCNAGTTWYVYPVSDASAPTWNGTLTGGGSTKALALCNGTNWTAH